MGVGTGLYMYDVVVKKFTFAISSPVEFLVHFIVIQCESATWFALQVAGELAVTNNFIHTTMTI